MISSSKHTVMFTGAGISTTCGIPDFRGPGGVWTARDAGKPPPKMKVTMEQAMPSRTHMAIKKLQDSGLIKHTISQNVDGLHRRSGLSADDISELHGNCYVEQCENGHEFLRDFDVMNHIGDNRIAHYHSTGRNCTECGKPLLDNIIHFGENLPEGELDKALKHSKKADLMIVIGSSLTVSPANSMPPMAKKLVIINLQKTDYDDDSDLRIFAKCDQVMVPLMEKLNQRIPRFRLTKKFSVGNTHSVGSVSGTHKYKLFVAGSCSAAPHPAYIDTVTFTLHETFKNPVHVIEEPPFELSASGWGTFDVKVDITFTDSTREPLHLTHEISFEGSGASKIYSVDFGPQPWFDEDDFNGEDEDEELDAQPSLGGRDEYESSNGIVITG
eukprot:TRINITY_DN2447_c0_g1_i1.p1 TRINITY_DN2447_c0_g1~~TRINITY_DN2447_c0_g1_i1.p1  ORF type:complete len:414 (+),score=111.51 TRINITY_DN2447_c0_g1_i1:88-1242(+)